MRSSLVLLAVLVGAEAGAQVAALDPDGVYIDAEGVLKTRRVETGKRLRALRKLAKKEKGKKQLGYVSLPRLFAEVKKKLDAGEKIPDEMLYLAGMTKLQYVFVYPEEKDLVIAGPCEPIVADFPERPVGRRTGRPLLRLDDVVTALRTCGPGKPGTPFGCTIKLTREVQQRMLDTFNELKGRLQKNPKKRGAVTRAMAKAGGVQPIAFFNIEPATRFAYVCVEADYMLKRHAIGLDRSPVKKAVSHIGMMTSPTTMTHRFWFEAFYEPLAVSPDGTAFKIRGQSLQIKTRRKFDEAAPDPADPVAQRYARSTTKHMTALSGTLLSWADLANLADLALLATLIGKDKLHEKAGWDLGWILDEYTVERVAVPKQASALVNSRMAGRALLFAAGGVKLSLGKYAAAREPDEGAASKARRPEEGWSTVTTSRR